MFFLLAKIQIVGYGTFVVSVAALRDTRMRRRLEDKIRELCARSIIAGEDELAIIADLRAALREHVERIRKVVVGTNFANAKNRLRLERSAKRQESREILLVPPQKTSDTKRKAG